MYKLPFKLRYVLLAILVIATIAAIYSAGYFSAESEYKAVIAQMEVDQVSKELAVKIALEREAMAKREAIAENEQLHRKLSLVEAGKERIIYRRVIEYVQTPNAAKCALPSNWVLTHDAAADLRRLPDDGESADALDDTTTGITDANALVVVTSNYQTCRDTANRLRELQGWVIASQKAAS